MNSIKNFDKNKLKKVKTDERTLLDIIPKDFANLCKDLKVEEEKIDLKEFKEEIKEFYDSKEEIIKKVKEIAKLVKNSKFTTIYTGAGNKFNNLK
jgi:DNA-binding ferritin-like protein